MKKLLFAVLASLALLGAGLESRAGTVVWSMTPGSATVTNNSTNTITYPGLLLSALTTNTYAGTGTADLSLTAKTFDATVGPGLCITVVGTNSSSVSNYLFTFVNSVDGTNFSTTNTTSGQYTVTVSQTGTNVNIFNTNFPTAFANSRSKIRLSQINQTNSLDNVVVSVVVTQKDDR